jgi:predicted RNA binding protein YcfA (HicA-like mRNA interferase family)
MTRMPQVTAQDLLRFLRAQGFADDRQSGSHLTLWNEERDVAVTGPCIQDATSGAAWRYGF